MMVTKTKVNKHSPQLFWQRKAYRLSEAVSLQKLEKKIRVKFKTKCFIIFCYRSSQNTLGIFFSTALTMPRISLKKNCKLVPTMCLSKIGRIHSFSSPIDRMCRISRTFFGPIAATAEPTHALSCKTESFEGEPEVN